MSTTTLNPTNSSKSNPPAPLSDSTTLHSNPKMPTTFIIQPPSAFKTRPLTLLTKRYNPAELGDLLLKKIKTQNSNNNSNQHSPTHNPNPDDHHLNCLESTSMIEEVSSPSIKSSYEEPDALNAQKALEGILMPQRSNTAPLMFNTFNLRHSKSNSNDPHRQVQHALEVLQKKIMMDQQASILKDLLFKVQGSQEPLIIPPLLSTSNSTQSSIVRGKSQESRTSKPISSLKDLENENDVYYGPVEYPLLAMAPPALEKSTSNTGSSSVLNDGKITAVRNPKPVKTENGAVDSLSATRAETQSLGSDGSSSSAGEEGSEGSERRRKVNKKGGNGKKLEASGKGSKGQKQEGKKGKDSGKVKRQRNEEVLSPLVKVRKMTERKKNKWQTGEAGNKEEIRQV